jgi:hypothetical protein
MTTTSANPYKSESILGHLRPARTWTTYVLVAWSSFFFAVLQSVCTFFVALGGIQLLIGVGSLAAITQAGLVWDRFHADSIRLPMMGFALAGALVGLAALARVRRLRDRPAAQWRRRPLTSREILRERIQFTLALATLALIALEEIMHLRTFHHL